MTEHPYQHLSGEELRRQARRADRDLGAEIDRLQIADERFRSVLRRSLDLEAEQEARKSR
jgi:hypothetical protein